jgi:regulator of RNase E activity RraA
MSSLSPQARDKLKKVSTATLTTALFKRGLRRQWIQDVHLINPAATHMVGIAFTLRYMPAREDLNAIEVFRDRNPSLIVLACARMAPPFIKPKIEALSQTALRLGRSR